jgi:SNF2 family DNA or RNA helicase
MTLGKEGKEGSQSSVPQLTEEERKRQLQELTEALQPHLLRRKKQDVDLQLPEMEEIIVKTALTDR